MLLPLKSARRSLVRLRQFPGIRRQRLLSKAESVLCYRPQQHWNSFEATHFVMALRESTIESGKSALYSSENMSHLSTRVHDSIRHGHYSPMSHLHGCTTRLSQRVVPDRCATHSADRPHSRITLWPSGSMAVPHAVCHQQRSPTSAANRKC